MKKSEARAQELIILIAKAIVDKKKRSHWKAELKEIRNWQLDQENILRYGREEKIKRDNLDMKTHADDRHREAQAHSDVFHFNVNYDDIKIPMENMVEVKFEKSTSVLAEADERWANHLRHIDDEINRVTSIARAQGYLQDTPSLWERIKGWFTGWGV